MLIDHTCGCGETYAVPDSQIGRAVRCPYCFGMSPVTRPARCPVFEPSRARALFALLFLAVPLGGAVAVWLGADRLPREPLPGSELAAARAIADEEERAGVDRPVPPVAAAPLEFSAPVAAPVISPAPVPTREPVAVAVAARSGTPEADRKRILDYLVRYADDPKSVDVIDWNPPVSVRDFPGYREADRAVNVVARMRNAFGGLSVHRLLFFFAGDRMAGPEQGPACDAALARIARADAPAVDPILRSIERFMHEPPGEPPKRVNFAAGP